jgi:RimJ/RimL family protein N-acetyltransferase
MEKMPYQPGLDMILSINPATEVATQRSARDWRHALPTLRGTRITLRELSESDAPSLLGAMSSHEVGRFISPPPSTLDGFQRFIAWAHRERAAGRYVCFAIVPNGSETAIGLFQLRSLDLDFATAEWGFALASEYWGTGIFTESARLVIDFAFAVIGAHRLEARSAVRNGRGNGALRKLGAVHECVLRRSFLRNGEYLDQSLWTILAEDWMQLKVACSPIAVH